MMVLEINGETILGLDGNFMLQMLSMVSIQPYGKSLGLTASGGQNTTPLGDIPPVHMNTQGQMISYKVKSTSIKTLMQMD